MVEEGWKWVGVLCVCLFRTHNAGVLEFGVASLWVSSSDTQSGYYRIGLGSLCVVFIHTYSEFGVWVFMVGTRANNSHILYRYEVLSLATRCQFNAKVAELFFRLA